jgi:predicted lipoprotein
MSNIPQEYLSIRYEEDFGFSAVDEVELKQVTDTNTLETKVIRETVSSSSEAVTRLEHKVDSILQLYEDGKLGLEAERAELLATTSGKLKELEQIIMPLLINLMKTPDKEYIYWPNRKDKIQEQVDKILAITRG